MVSGLEIENLSPKLDALGSSGIDISTNRRATKEMALNGLAENANGSQTFTDILKNSVSQVNDFQVQADDAVKELVAGRTKNVHETMLAVERADLALKLMVQVRNKILDAYREIIRMQV